MNRYSNKSNASSRDMISGFLVRVPNSIKIFYESHDHVLSNMCFTFSGNNMSGSTNNHKTNISLEGKVVVVSHVFYMTGKDSKYFFIELEQNGSSKTNQIASCTILARVKDLDRSLLNLQMKSNSSNSLIGKRYG